MPQQQQLRESPICEDDEKTRDDDGRGDNEGNPARRQLGMASRAELGHHHDEDD
eukprot:CAMPEP_0198130428 /NCGR_PEP_ID=MMETSP1442-20131203/53984_1 /TAXON_ID= /ORGANISM="Craspedostauros australis, Strain CCMP3328" /LENGTH=53 /DNA_ID=CAMNT_0043791051 /DNA_START=200 /DNA_END=358 /DNA_ORIENTATION=-